SYVTDSGTPGDSCGHWSSFRVLWHAPDSSRPYVRSPDQRSAVQIQLPAVQLPGRRKSIIRQSMIRQSMIRQSIERMRAQTSAHEISSGISSLGKAESLYESPGGICESKAARLCRCGFLSIFVETGWRSS